MTTQNPSLGNAQIVLNTHAEATFQVPDVTKVLAVPDLLRLYMEPAVVALAEKIESDLLSMYAQFTADSVLGSGGTAITEAVVDQAETALFNAKVPARVPRYLVLGGDAHRRCGKSPGSASSSSAGEAGLRALIDGSVGRMKNFFVFRSQFVPKTGSTPTTSHNLAFAKDAIGLVMQRSTAASGDGRDCRISRVGQLRHARGDELPAEYVVAAVHGGCVVRRRRTA